MNRLIVNLIALVGSISFVFISAVVWIMEYVSDHLSVAMFTLGLLGVMCAAIELEKDYKRYKKKKERKKNHAKNRVLV